MSYLSVMDTANSFTLQQRVQACAAQEAAAADVVLPGGVAAWVLSNMLALVASSGWADKWQYAKDTESVNNNPDTGARNDVISDADILAAVQPRVLALNPPDPA